MTTWMCSKSRHYKYLTATYLWTSIVLPSKFKLLQEHYPPSDWHYTKWGRTWRGIADDVRSNQMGCLNSNLKSFTNYNLNQDWQNTCSNGTLNLTSKQ